MQLKRRSFLTTVGAALAAGMLRIKTAIGGEQQQEIEPLGAPIVQPSERVRRDVFDERWFGDGLPIEQTSVGREYVVIEGKPIALLPFAQEYDYLNPERECVMTESGLRVLDREADLASQKPINEMVWKDPADGKLKKISQLPRGAHIGSWHVTFRREGQTIHAPLCVRSWQDE